MKKRKKGSSLIVVVMIFGFLVVFAGGMLAMTAGEYKLRSSESKRVENLYGAESGIDVVQNLIGKTFEAAVKYSNIKIEKFKTGKDEYINNNDSKNYLVNAAAKEEAEKEIQLINSNTSLKDSEKADKIKAAQDVINDSKSKMDEALNKEFKIQFNEFIKPLDSTKKYVEQVGKNQDELRKAISTNSYIKSFNNDGSVNETAQVQFDTDSIPEIFYYKDKKTTDDGKTNYDGIQPLDKDSNQSQKSEDITKYKVKITSEFKSSNGNNGENKRTVQVNFELIVPDYKDTKYSENKKVELKDYPAISQKLMTIDGNMNIDTNNSSNPINFYGNVHITGDSNTAGNYGSSIAYTKYKGGLSISNSTVNFMKGYLATGETFNVESNSKVNADNIYARNIYIGIKDGQSQADSSDITVKGSVFTDNDLTLKADNSHVTMDSFYGLNDKNVKTNDSTQKDRTSSSILVNGEKGSSLTVKTNAVIMGVGYINASDGYMTGESTAVKGNYLAYADPTDYPNVELKQYGNLQLLDDKALTVFQKSDKFKKYWENQTGFNDGGISLPAEDDATISTGAFFFKDKEGNINIKPGNSTIDVQSKVGTQRKDYGNKVYRLGKGVVNEDYYNDESGKWTVGNKVHFDVDSSKYNLNEQNSKKYKLIFNSDSNKTIVLKGRNDSSKEAIVDNGNEIDVYGSLVNAVIITNGNVKVEGSLKFIGNIIASGNVTISGDEQKDLVYDNNVSNIIQADNIDLINEIFKDTSSETLSSYINTSENSEGDISQYSVNNYLKTKLWKIVV